MNTVEAVRQARGPITSRSESSVSLRCTYRYGGLALQSACINFDSMGQTVEIYWSSTRTRSASVPVVSRRDIRHGLHGQGNAMLQPAK